MGQDVLISIITVSYNSERYIRDTIESVLRQSYSNFEYILIDGGSTDNTIEIAGEYQTKMAQKFVIVSEKDNGIYDAMNKGIELSKGELICIINSDDYFENKALESYYNCYLRYGKVDNIIIIGNANMVDIAKNLRYERTNNEKILNEKIEFTMPLTHPAFCVHRNIYLKLIGKYNHKIRIISDYDFTYRAYKSKIVKFAFTNKVSVNMREGGISDKFNLSSIINRTVSRYYLRRKFQNTYLNLYLCAKFLFEELLRQFLKTYFTNTKLLKTNR